VDTPQLLFALSIFRGFKYHSAKRDEHWLYRHRSHDTIHLLTDCLRDCVKACNPVSALPSSAELQSLPERPLFIFCTVKSVSNLSCNTCWWWRSKIHFSDVIAPHSPSPLSSKAFPLHAKEALGGEEV
jgi:hypothetical protein